MQVAIMKEQHTAITYEMNCIGDVFISSSDNNLLLGNRTSGSKAFHHEDQDLYLLFILCTNYLLFSS